KKSAAQIAEPEVDGFRGLSNSVVHQRNRERFQSVAVRENERSVRADIISTGGSPITGGEVHTHHAAAGVRAHDANRGETAGFVSEEVRRGESHVARSDLVVRDGHDGIGSEYRSAG